MAKFIDFSQSSLYFSVLTIAFNPLFWNVVARNGGWYLNFLLEYNHKTLTKYFQNPRHACYFLAITIFLLGLFRDALFERALRHQPFQASFYVPLLAYALLFSGNLLVLSSMWALGITGTYLGDYFGILMDAPVTGFPFNITGAPMYYGSSMSFLGSALLYGRPAGVVLAGMVFMVYQFALALEDPFTSEIYAKRERERKEGKKA